MRYEPPATSAVSAKGPSVTSTSPSRTRTVVVVSTGCRAPPARTACRPASDTNRPCSAAPASHSGVPGVSPVDSLPYMIAM